MTSSAKGFVSSASAHSLEGFILVDRKLGVSNQIVNVSQSGKTCQLISNLATQSKVVYYPTDKIARGCKEGRFRLFSLS